MNHTFWKTKVSRSGESNLAFSANDQPSALPLGQVFDIVWLQELKQAFVAEAASSGNPRLLLTAAVGAGKEKIDTAYDIPVLSRSVSRTVFFFPISLPF